MRGIELFKDACALAREIHSNLDEPEAAFRIVQFAARFADAVLLDTLSKIDSVRLPKKKRTIRSKHE